MIHPDGANGLKPWGLATRQQVGATYASSCIPAGVGNLVVTAVAALYSGAPAGSIAPGRRSLVAQIAGAARAIVTGATSIKLVPARVGLGLIVVAARQFGVHIGSADFTGIAGNRSTPP